MGKTLILKVRTNYYEKKKINPNRCPRNNN